MLSKRNGSFKKAKIMCACSNCKNNLNVCFTDLSCYRYYDNVNCGDSSFCYGCFNNQFQTLQCNLNSKQFQIVCCSGSNFCNLNNSTSKETYKYHVKLENGNFKISKLNSLK